MMIDSCFQLKEDQIESVIDKLVIAELPEADRPIARTRAIGIVKSFEGWDADAASVLIYAAKRGKFEEYAQRLENFYDKDLGYVHPGARRMAGVSGAIKAKGFFLNCYEEMGIKPRQR